MSTVAEVPFADLPDRLGGVPRSRVRLEFTPGTATKADLLAAMRTDGWRVS